MNLGRFHFLPLPLLRDIGGSMLRLQRRSLAADAASLLASTVPAPRIDGTENIPAGGGPLLVVANHYQRPGLWIGYTGAMIAHGVRVRRGEEVCIGVIDRAVIPLAGRRMELPGTHWTFRRIAAVWDMIAMPVDVGTHTGRGAAVRRFMETVLPPPRGSGRIGVLFPEGHHGHDRHLSPALPGTGTMAILLCAGGVQLLPVGIYEEGSRPVARFGLPFIVDRGHGLTRDQSDERARRDMMARIAALLPARMRR